MKDRAWFQRVRKNLIINIAHSHFCLCEDSPSESIIGSEVRLKMMQKFGLDEISRALLELEITSRQIEEFGRTHPVAYNFYCTGYVSVVDRVRRPIHEVRDLVFKAMCIDIHLVFEKLGLKNCKIEHLDRLLD